MAFTHRVIVRELLMQLADNKSGKFIVTISDRVYYNSGFSYGAFADGIKKAVEEDTDKEIIGWNVVKRADHASDIVFNWIPKGGIIVKMDGVVIQD